MAKNRMVMANSSKWAKIVAAWNTIVEYIGDVMTGQKYKNISAHKKQDKQK